MNKKLAVVALSAIICSAAVCAKSFFDEKPLYAKLSAGYESRTVKVPYHTAGHTFKDFSTFKDSIGFFKLKPSAGMVLFPEHSNFFLKGLAAEANIDFGFGGKKYDYLYYGADASAFTIVPGAKAVWNATFLNSRFIPYAFFGFEVPISIVSAKIKNVEGLNNAGWRVTSGGFDVDIGVGVTFNLTEKIGITADFSGFFGTSNGFSLAAGASYRFK